MQAGLNVGSVLAPRPPAVYCSRNMSAVRKCNRRIGKREHCGTATNLVAAGGSRGSCTAGRSSLFPEASRLQYFLRANRCLLSCKVLIRRAFLDRRLCAYASMRPLVVGSIRVDCWCPPSLSCCVPSLSCFPSLASTSRLPAGPLRLSNDDGET